LRVVVLAILIVGISIMSSQSVSASSINVSGNATLTINSATAGQQPGSVTNSTTTLTWNGIVANTSVAVSTNIASPKFTLKVLATSVDGGTAAPEVTLTTTAQTLVNVTDNGSCTLKYTGSTTISAGVGTDIHTITFTLQL
ncbi:MAG: hypothetical protein QG641_2745, partial [Candidatus Poribacteria bacterium]|nr:hypothetical protein [Candidatus Poribacteria bacterium]